MAVPPARLEAVAARVSAEPAVNHNYEREHDLNLWFVVAAPDRAPWRRPWRALPGTATSRCSTCPWSGPITSISASDWAGRASPHAAAPKVESRRPSSPTAKTDGCFRPSRDGLPLVPRPFAEVAETLGWSEAAVLDRLRWLCEGGVISRFGLIVRHRSLGYRANAMAVWDVPDGDVESVAAAFAGQPFVTLCYRRPRRRPRWPYNLFCMIHGRDREHGRKQIDLLNEVAGTWELPQAVLFSRRCFKQRGARFSRARLRR